MITCIAARGAIENIPAFITMLADAAKQHGVAAQCFDNDAIYSEEQIRIAHDHARIAIENGTALTSDLATELLLRVSCQHQITVALERVGITPKTRTILIALIGACDEARIAAILATLKLQKEPAVGVGVAALDRYSIDATERAVVGDARQGDLILEKIALVKLMK